MANPFGGGVVADGDERVAVFFQKSTTTNAEMDLVGRTIARDLLLEKLKKVMDDVNTHRRKQDDDSTMDTLCLLIAVRNATFDLVESTVSWQQAFTTNIRPQLCQQDYLVKMIGLVEFISWTVLRKEFNFKLEKNNVFLLPLPNLRTTGTQSTPGAVSSFVVGRAMPT